MTWSVRGNAAEYGFLLREVVRCTGRTIRCLNLESFVAIVHLREYRNKDYCFLSWADPLAGDKTRGEGTDKLFPRHEWRETSLIRQELSFPEPKSPGAGASVMSDPAGHYVLACAREGDGQFTVEASNFATLTKPLRVRAGTMLKQKLTLALAAVQTEG